MLKWIGNTHSPVIRFGDLLEAKAVVGQVKFQVGATPGVKDKAWVKTNDPAHWGKAGWNYWMPAKTALAHGIQDGSIVHVTKNHQPLKPGDIDPETGKPAPAAVPPSTTAAPAAAPQAAPPAAALPPPAPKAALPPEPKPEPAPSKAEPEPEPEPAKATEPPPPPPPVAKEPEPPPAAKEPPKAPEVVPPSTAKETAKLKKKVPLGTVRYHSIKAGEPAKQVLIRATDDPNHPRGGWKYLMTVDAAAKQGIHHDDVLAFTYTPDPNNIMKGKIDLHTDEHGHIKKLSTAAQFPKPEMPKAEPPKAAPEAPPEAPKAAEKPAEKAKAPEAPPEAPKAAKAPVEGGVPPEKVKDLVAYLKTLPGFEAAPSKFLTLADGGPTLFNQSLQTKFGVDWYDKWKEATGATDAKAEKPKEKPKKLLSFDELPDDVKKKLGEMGASKNSLIAQVAGALHSLGKQTKDDISAETKLDPSHVQVALDHLKDHGYVTKHADDTYGLNTGWTTTATPEAGKKEPAAPVAPPAPPAPAKKVSASFKAIAAKHDIDPGSDAEKVVKVVDMHGPSSQEVLFKETGLSAFSLNTAVKWLLDKNLLKHSKGNYSFGSDWTTAAAGPEPEAEPKAAKKAVPPEAPPEKSEPSVGLAGKSLLPPTEIPSVDDLKYVESGADRGMGGAGEKHIYKDKKGNEWIFKVAKAKDGTSEKPFAAYAQETYSNIAMKVKSIHIPIKVTHIKGKMGTLQPYITKSGDLKTAPSASTLTALEREDVASEHALDWLMSQHDSFGANLIRTKTGRILGVDKEQGFRYFGEDKLSTDYKPNTEFHGEKPPYYNQFWNEWSEKKFDFDPTVMKKYFDSIDAIDDDEFVENFKPYAESFWKDKPKKQEEFLNELRKRKKNVRSDFEDFLTGLYKKRTGQSEGEFTFKAGWVPGAKEEPGKIKKKVHKYDSATIAGDYGILTKPYVPLQGPNKGVSDPTKIAVKAGNGPDGAAKLGKFIKEMGLTPHVPDYSKAQATKDGVIQGNTYNWAFFDKDKWDNAYVEKTEEVGTTVGNTPPKPEYHPEIENSPDAHSNLHELEGLHHVVLPALGKRLTLDGGAVEGQHARAKKFIDKKGDPYYLFQFKLREVHWKDLAGGDKANWAFTQAQWDPSQHAFVEGSGHSDVVPTKKWVNGDSEIHLANTSPKWAYMGSMYAKVRPKKGETPAQALRKLLETVTPGLADKVLTPPSEEEREIVKLSRVLWSVAPQESDALPEEKRTVVELKKRLKKHGYGEQELGDLKEVEAFPGYATWTKPGRHKQLAKGKLRYLFNGISSDEAALSIMQYGLLGIHERNLLGLPQFGGSYPQDVASGSGDGILTRVVTDSGLSESFNGHAFHGKFQVLITPSEVDRLDTYVHSDDKYGTCRADNPSWKQRESIENRLEGQQKHYSSGMEMSFRKGIGRGKLLRIVCGSEAARKGLIKQAKQMGIMQVNGVPVDDFVVVATNLGEAYTKYVKPLGF